MSKIMGGFGRTCYFISPHIDYDYLKSTNLNLIPIETDGTYFLEEFRRIYVGKGVSPKIIPEDSFDNCQELLIDINDLHNQTADEFQEHPKLSLILALSYQDGLQDALMRIKDLRYSGEYYDSDRVHSLVHAYENKAKIYRRQKNLWDACYCRGYMNGMLFLLSGGDFGYPPSVEVVFDSKIDTVAKLKRLANRKLPLYAKKQLDRIFVRCGKGALIPEHMPYV
jgi:hypothetical protein